MTLMDQIIDEAEEAATVGVLGNDWTDTQVIDLISDIVRVHLHPKSTAAMLAVATYARIDNARNVVDSLR